ncbi:MAG: translocation/assembly module TamB domain-containing protein [Cyanobacteria bacterium P01_F01_bin.143]
MTKSINNTPPNPEPENQDDSKGLLDKLKPSKKKVIWGLGAIATVGAIGYGAAQYFVRTKLPPILETQISDFIKRPIDIGEVKSFSLGGIEFGETTLPPTATDTDKLSLEGLKVNYNIFPLIFRRTLPADITVINPEVYLEQTADGEWVNLDFLPEPDPNQEKKELPVKINAGVDLQDAKVTLVPYGKSPIEVGADGTARYNQNEGELVAYDLDTTIQKAQATLQGNTHLETGETQTKVLVKDLALNDLATLIPNSPVTLNSGVLNTDLDVDIPSFEEITSADIQGLVSINDVAGEVTDLSTAIQAQSELNFDGNNAQITRTQASFGDIVAQVAGNVNLDRGYDLDVDVLPFRLSSLPPDILKQIPVPIGGEVTAAVQLTGEIDEPLVTGRVNNTRPISIDKTQFETIQADFQADLSEAVLENLEITPVAGGTINAEGIILTKIEEALANKQSIDPNKMPLEFNFTSELPLEDLARPYYELPAEVTVNNLTAQGKVMGTISDLNAVVNWQIPEAETGTATNVAGSGEVFFSNNQLQVQNTQVSVGDGVADVDAIADLETNQWQADVNANALYLTPFLSALEIPNVNLDRPVSVDNLDVQLNGRLDELDPNKVTAVADVDLDINRGKVAVNSQLNSGVIEATTTTDNIALQPFVEDLLPVSANLNRGIINVSGKLEELLAFAEEQKLDSFKLDADLGLDVDGNAIAVDSQLDSGIVSGNVNTNSINLNRIVAALPVNANLRSSATSFSGELQQLLAFAENGDLSSFRADVDADLDLAGGAVNAIAQLNNNQFSTNIDANDISSAALLNTVSRRSLTSLDIEDIDAQIDISGDISPLLNNEINIPISIDQVAVQSGAQQLNASGNLNFSDITSNPDLSDANLDVAANVDFDQLPIKELVAIASNDNELVADSVNIAGKTKFNGVFNGKNLISAPIDPGNVKLLGDLQLLDFGVNNVDFDPVMAGKVDVNSGSEIALNLRGNRDVIAVAAEPCTTSDCTLPYLPTNLEFRQGENTDEPIIVTGNKQQQIFALDINNFPLSLLALAPGKAAGLEGNLAGETTGKINLNLFNFGADGQVKVTEPGVGYINADQVTADFKYDPNSNVAELTTATLDLIDSQYNLSAALNLQTAEMDGKLEIPEAYIEDIFTTLRWFTVQDAINLFNNPDYGALAEITPRNEIEGVNDSIEAQIDRLQQIENAIQKLAAEREQSGVPTQLDIQGKYTGLISFGGTIEEPEADFKIEANDWQWEPQEKFFKISQSEGLVREASSTIKIPQILVDGDLQGTTLNLETAKLQVEETVFSASGKLSTEEEDLSFGVADLTLDTIGKFVELPVDADGAINVNGKLTGTLEKPQLKGEVAFVDGYFNGNPLPKQFVGQFDYDSTRLQFDTTEPSFIHVDATVPYPIIPGTSDRVDAEVKLDTEAFALLGILSGGYLDWVGGTGDVDVKVTALLDLEKAIPVYDLVATGVVNLDNSQVNLVTPFFSAPFQGTGQVTLNNQMLTVESLTGTFAEKDLSVYGSLPLLSVVNNLENPLTVNLPEEGDINIEKLYKGGVAGDINVTGAALQPVIGGDLTIGKGRVYIPKPPAAAPSDSDVTEVAQNNTRRTTVAATETDNQAPASGFVTTLDNFQIALADISIRQNPLFRIDIDGDLVVNGTVDDPSNIKPEGTITLGQAWINFLSNQFLVDRSRENTVVFSPEAGILNPYLDLIFQATINEFDEADSRTAELGSNEINDPISQVNYRNSITVNLVIDGETTDILPILATENDCVIRPTDTPLLEAEGYYSKAELDKLTACFNGEALTADESDSLDLSGVELTSIPFRSQKEITTLLGNEFLSFAETLATSSQSELFDLGVNTFVIDPAYRRVFYVFDSRVVKFGRRIGLDYLHVFPDLEGIYEINKDSSIRSTYNYGVPNSQEIRVEYQRRF